MEVVRILLNKGASVGRPYGVNNSYDTTSSLHANLSNAGYRTPFHSALYTHNLDIARLLVNRGAAGDHANSVGWTPLFYLLTEHADKARLDAVTPPTEFLALLLDDSLALDPDARDATGLRVLDYVVRYGTAAEVRMLLALGASLTVGGDAATVHDPWREPGSAISQAIATDNVDTFEALLPYHAVDGEFDGSWTMLALAAYLGHTAMVWRLLSHGAAEFHIDAEEVWKEVDDEDADGLVMTDGAYRDYLDALVAYGRIVICEEIHVEESTREIYWTANEW